MPATPVGSSAAKDFGRWLRGILSIIGGVWVICIIAGFFGSIMMNCGRVVYVEAPSPRQSPIKGVGGNPPVIFDGSESGGGGIGIPMLQSVQVIPYDVIEARECGIRRRRGGYLPPVCVPQQNQQMRRW